MLEAGRARAGEIHPILPRVRSLRADDPRPCLLLPWDPEYDAATGEGVPLPSNPSWARGPSRFVLEDRTWKHVDGRVELNPFARLDRSTTRELRAEADRLAALHGEDG